ncbi:aspartate ammonia-lyase [uncultured Acinetobacter sp.]|uniref:aspartate ammonia-lyase n=1 Tax=uncultured Acinetobacter sp. TaxID=165433 RepID=UPI0026112091|nr:aspartate ammonia-lyase [uncultured Acinetobacter sp.]
MSSLHMRLEKDLLGTKQVNDAHYYGIQTLRALENFDLTSSKLSSYPYFIQALAMVKLAAAEANYQLKLLPEAKYQAIKYACEQLMQGQFLQEFPLDMLQGGAGTSTNMNANEVICNIALEYMGHAKGQYQYLHPNNDVNMSQSTNDVYPTAIRLALLGDLERYQLRLTEIVNSLKTKALAFHDVLKMGRTQLQDAVPMTLGQEFHAFASILQQDLPLLASLPELLGRVNLGGTAIGTGINAPAHYQELALAALSRLTNKNIQAAPDLIAATSDMGDFVLVSGYLKRTATKLSKIANDIRLLSSGPRAGLNEIHLQARQPGSSIMPGKVNPVIPEAMNMAAFQVIANDLAITLAADAGQFQLNAMEPLIAFKLFDSLDVLQRSVQMFDQLCIQGIQANAVQCRNNVDNSIGIITALNPYLGYETTTRLAQTAHETGQRILDLVRTEGLLSEEVLQYALFVDQMLQPPLELAI